MKTKNKIHQKNPTDAGLSKIYDLKNLDSSMHYNYQLLFCLCKEEKITPTSFLLKFYTHELINSISAMILLVAYTILYKHELLQFLNQNDNIHHIPVLCMSTTLVLLLIKLIAVYSNRQYIKNSKSSHNLNFKNSFSKLTNFILLGVLGYLVFVTLTEATQLIDKGHKESNED